MFSLLAIFAVIGGLVILPAAPAIGFFAIAGGMASAGKAINRPDDLPFALGLAIMFAIGFAACQFTGWLLSP